MRSEILAGMPEHPAGGDYVAQLHRAVHAVGLFIDARTAGEVSQPEALVLAHLGRRGTSTPSALHHAFLHRRSTLTSVIDRLEGKGLVRRRTAENDRRSFTVELTRIGRARAKAVLQAFDELRAAADRGRKPSEAAAHAAFLEALAETAATLANEEA